MPRRTSILLLPMQTQNYIGLFMTLFLICFNSFINLCSCQSAGAPQNIQVYYPFSPAPLPSPVPSPSPSSSSSSSPSPAPVPILPPSGPSPLPPETQLPPPVTQLPPAPIVSTPPPPSNSVSKKSIYTAVGVTAASTLVVAGLAFFLCTAYSKKRRRNAAVGGHKGGGGGGATPMLQPQTEFSRFDGQVKGLIVDENGLDVLYWKKLEGGQRKGSHRQDILERLPDSGKKTMNRVRSSSSNNQIHPAHGGDHDRSNNIEDGNGRAGAGLLPPPPLLNLPPPPGRTPPPLPNLPPPPGRAGSRRLGQPSRSPWFDSASSASQQPLQPSSNLMAIPKEERRQQPPQPIRIQQSAPPPPSAAAASTVEKKNPTPTAAPPPPPPPPGGKKGPAPPPPPPPKSRESGSKPPSVRKQNSTSNVASSSESNDDQVQLKPLYWEKVNVNTDHSMVWNKLDKGSFQYDGDMMEALFGTVAASRKSPKSNKKNTEPNPSAKIFILEARRSQNIAIVLRSLGMSRTELIETLLEGRGLNSETLEKLARITPTEEESSQILGFNGDPARLADAESFLYYLLKAIPSAFTRANAMLFRLNYDSEVTHLKESLQTLESACNELRTRGIFLKLLEAILKAGNRLNAGTSRGNATAFSLSTLLKLSDYKSSDGKTTLLHFVVHEVVRNEGRRCVMSSLSRSNSRSNSNNHSSSSQLNNPPKSKEEQEKEFLKLGLPVVGGLSPEFSTVKKAAAIDYDTLVNTITSLTARVNEIQQLLAKCGNRNSTEEEDHFTKEMRGFIQSTKEELSVMKEEQTRVMEILKRTNQYYQSGASKDKEPLRLFMIVNSFLGMVDQTCIEIARSVQQKKSVAGNRGVIGHATIAIGSPKSPQGQEQDVLRTRVTFPRLPDHFLSDKSSASGSDDEA